MNSCKPRVIHERSHIISINKNNSTSQESFRNNEYSLKKNFFDPTKSSPPNQFMQKLQMRMKIYDSLETSVDNWMRE